MNHETLPIDCQMYLKILRNFFADIFDGLPVGAALFAAAMLGIFALVPSLNPSDDRRSTATPDRLNTGVVERLAVKLGRNENITNILKRHGLPQSSSQELLKKMRDIVDWRRMPRDQSFNLVLDAHSRNLRAVEFVLQNHIVRASATLGGWSVEREELFHVARLNLLRVKVSKQFSESAAQAGLSSAQIAELHRIFSSELDLSADLSAGDEVSVAMPQKYYLDGHVVVGQIAAARVVAGGRSYEALGFSGADDSLQYYDIDGNLLPSSFLAAPLKFDRISSTFDLARPDPATGVLRPHEAVDYQAPHGTPVVAVGSGTVEFAGWRGGYGFMVEVKHAGGYSSTYAHLSRIAAGLEQGVRIKVGEPIGAVGQSGYVTGPHLHFEFALNGERIDFLSVKIPGPDSLTGVKLQQFKREQEKWLAVLSGDANSLARLDLPRWY
jgi:murein DD-endopeptidase MepM/ murein hydrolase activator NlpD